MAMPERGYAADRLDPSLANYALTLSSGFAGGGLIEDAANSFTVEFWVKPVTEHEIDVETNTGYGGTDNQKFVIFPAHGGAAETGKAGMGVSVGTNGVSVYEHAGGYMPAILVWASPTPLTAWTHVAVVYNNKLPSLYINGVLVHTAGAASTKDYVYPCYQFPGGYYGTQTGGQMDEVRIWGVARTQAQIAANMNTEVAANSANLLGYWPMNEGTGTMLTDVTGNGRNIDLTAFGAGYSSSGSWTSTGTAAIAAKAAYRYGFNGKEKDQDIGEDDYDFGARIYDSRIGKWFSIDPMREVYTSLSPYSYSANNPINVLDAEGNVLKDKNGNIIATNTGVISSGSYPSTYTQSKNGITESTVSLSNETIKIYADDGTPIEALRLIEAHVTIKKYDAKGNFLSMSKESLSKHGYEAVSDCHGYTFAKGKLWINDDQVNTLLDHDGYSRNTTEDKADAVIFKKGGQIVHSAVRNKDGTYSNDAGILMLEKNVSLPIASRGLTDVTTPGNLEFVDKKGSDKVIDAKGGTVKGAVRYTTEAEIQKLLKPAPALGSSSASTPSVPKFNFKSPPQKAAANATYVKPVIILPLKKP